MPAKELCKGYSEQTKFYVLQQAHNAKFKTSFRRNNSSLQHDQQEKLRVSQKIYFSASKMADIMSPDRAGSHAMGTVGLVGNRVVFFFTVRAPFFFMCMH